MVYKEVPIIEFSFVSVTNEQDYLVSRRERRVQGNADLIMFCHGRSAASDEFDTRESESMFT